MPFPSLGCEAGDLGNSLTLTFFTLAKQAATLWPVFLGEGAHVKELWGSFKCGQ